MPRLITAGIKHTNMKSRISIEVDFENGNTPIIQILRAFPEHGSEQEDVRDKLVHAFCRSLEYTSSWAKFEFMQNHTVNGVTEFQRIKITTVTPKQLNDEALLMMKQAESYANDLKGAIAK